MKKKKLTSFPQILNEVQSEASKQAHEMGLVYGGHAQWIDPQTRETKARSVKTASGTKLVKVGEGEEEDEQKDKGKLSILDFDDALLNPKTDLKVAPAKDYVNLIRGLHQHGGDVIVMCGRGDEKIVAAFLAKLGITRGMKLAPVGHTDPNRKKEFVKKKIKAGYKEIMYLDDSKKNLAAVQSLRATFNRAQIQLDVHEIKPINAEVEQHFDKKIDRAK